MIDATPITRKVQKSPIPLLPLPRKVIANINVLTVSVKVITPGISMMLPCPLCLIPLVPVSSLTRGTTEPLGINFHNKKKNIKANGIAE